MRRPRTTWTPEENKLLTEIWHSDKKLESYSEQFRGRTGASLYDHGTKILMLGPRRAPADLEHSLSWQRIRALLHRRPMTARQISEAVGVGLTQVLDMLRIRHGKLVYVHDWSSQFTKGGPSQIWALGQEKDAKKPRPMTREQITQRYRDRLREEEPERIDAWVKRQKIREREKRGTLARRDVAASWI